MGRGANLGCSNVAQKCHIRFATSFPRSRSSCARPAHPRIGRGIPNSRQEESLYCRIFYTNFLSFIKL